MEPVIEISTGRYSLTMTGSNIAGGYIYDNDTLDSWLSPAEVDGKLSKRPNAHGTYLPDQLFVGAHRVNASGKYFGKTPLEAVKARNLITGLLNDGRPVMMTVTDALGATSRTGLVVDVDVEWMPDSHFIWTLVMDSPDPRRYSDLTELETGLATPSSGLVWPLGSSASGLFWDWGTAGNSGRVNFTNDGNTATYPVLLVGDGGSFPSGFAVTEVNTGREVAYGRDTAGGIVRLDNRTRRAQMNGGDITGGLTRREWFEVPPGATYSYQFATLGTVTGAPKMRILAADAYL